VQALDITSDARSYPHAGPTVARMLLGAQLRRLREEAGITREHAGETIRASGSKISRLELGRTGFKIRDVTDLLTLYGVSDEADRVILTALARHANVPGWWRLYGDVIPPWFEPYLGMEQGASVIRCFEIQFVPGLLQTESYARAVMRLDAAATETEINLRLAVRMRRQQLVHWPGAPHLWAVIDEAVLSRPMGGAEIMREQIQHLIELSRLPHVTIQIVPFSAGGHPAAGGPITLLRFGQGCLPDVVYLEQLDSAIYLDKPSDSVRYWNVLNSLATEAAHPAASIQMMRRLLDTP
jgi:transcriptional regulator with XRE-family HTH domain